MLIAAKANIHAWDDYALQQAVRNGHLKVVQLLVDNGANIPAWNDYTLQLAVRNGDSEIVKLLVDKGANIHSWIINIIFLIIKNIVLNDVLKNELVAVTCFLCKLILYGFLFMAA